MKVNEIFYSLQGEGRFTGTPAVFIRLSGCNLKCDFCDTEHRQGMEMSEDEIVKEVLKYPTKHVVITGGEPLLQLTPSLLQKLHKNKKYIQVETNGSINPQDEILLVIDWITCSPKYGNIPNIQKIDELKVVYDIAHPEFVTELENVQTTYNSTYYLQPCDRQNTEYNETNIASCLKYILEHPKWKLSLQTHKLLGLR